MARSSGKESDARRASSRRGDVTLGELGDRHAAATFLWVSDREVARNLGLRRTPTLAGTAEWIAALRGREDARAFAILVDGAHVGNLVLDQIDRYLGTTRLSIYIGPRAARGGGVGRTAIGLVLREAFGAMGLHKVWLTVHPDNAAAIRAYSAIGFQLEGVLRDEFILDGVRVPALRMGILAGECGPQPEGGA